MQSVESALVVDDDLFVRTTIMQQLRTVGLHRVEGAADGGEARRRLASGERFDVVITDLLMPGEDGLQLLRALSTEHAAPSVILISGLESKLLQAAEQIAQQRGIRVLGSLVKPISTVTLRTLLERAGAPQERDTEPAGGGEAPDITPEELMAALHGDEIHIALQPQVRTLDNRPYGAEALARWTPAGRKPIPPALFVALAERSNLITALTDTIVRQAFATAADWQHRGLGLHVSVNLAPLTLGSLDTPDRLVAAARAAGASPGRIVLEVTEGGIVDQGTNVLEVLTRLRLAGFGISIDDFGTGYSSLQRLNWVPFTELKIDQSFVKAAPGDAKARSIVQSSIVLARDLGLISVAEGVETAEQRSLLGELGCNVLQGYYVSPPLPPEEASAWLSTRIDNGSDADR